MSAHAHQHSHDHEHGHEPGHAHAQPHAHAPAHAHAHAHDHSARRSDPGVSLLRMSSLQRLAIALALVVAIWLGVFWAWS